MRSYVARRLLIALPQMFAILFITFVLTRALPGDPARLQLGTLVSEDVVEALRHQMRLDEPIAVQFVAYLERLATGDLGQSWVTRTPVAADLADRVPATVELIVITLITILLVMIPLGVLTATPGRGRIKRPLGRLMNGYGLLAGGFPEFYVGLVLLFVFFTVLNVLPGPEGRLSIGALPPPRVTGFYTIDSIIALDFPTFVDAIAHLILPVLSLTLAGGAIVYKLTWVQTATALRSDFTAYTEAIGLPRWRVLFYALRAGMPPVVVVVAIMISYMLGGVVLIETVFNRNGIGQYAVQSVVSSDYAPLQGFVLVAALFTMLVYLLGDLIYAALDPRVRIEGGK